MVLAVEWFLRAARACQPDLVLSTVKQVKVLRGIKLEGFADAGDCFTINAKLMSADADADIGVELRGMNNTLHYSAVVGMTERAVAAPARGTPPALEAWTSKSDEWTWNPLYTPYDESYVKDFYRFVEEGTGRRYRLGDMTAPGGASPEKRNPHYEFLGVTRYWRYSEVNMKKLHKEGRVVQTAPGRVPQYKRYLDEMQGVALQNDWGDVKSVAGGENLGYPTQKPLALLERIVQASSNEGDVVLDPFCGCGTAVHASEKLKRKWIGIDITHLAISLIEKRLRDAFPQIKFGVHGTPTDVEGARNLATRDKYQFQWWACSLVNAQPFGGKKKGADGGIDGLLYFQDDEKTIGKIVVSVKGGDNVNVAMVRDLAHVIAREKAQLGLFVTLAEPTRPMKEEAVKEGYYESPLIKKAFPKLQILTIAGLINGTERPNYPELGRGGLTFKKAKREDDNASQTSLFGDDK